MKKQKTNTSLWDETAKKVDTLKCLPLFKSETVLVLETYGFPKDVAFLTLSFLIPQKLNKLIDMKLWESAANTIADSGFYELLRYYLLDLDRFQEKHINNIRNFQKACREHDENLLRLIIQKYQDREHVANHFNMWNSKTPLSIRDPEEFNQVMKYGLGIAATHGFLDGIKIIDKVYFGSYDEAVGKALDAGHKNIVNYLTSLQ
jgi:hypothetical protein